MALTQSVRVWSRSEAGTDPMGDTVYEWAPYDVDGALVRPLEGSDLERGDSASDLRPDGVRVLFSVALPKGYAGPPLRHARVTLLHPSYGMDLTSEGWRTALAVSGDPQPTIPCPTRWDTIVEVGRTDG